MTKIIVIGSGQMLGKLRNLDIEAAALFMETCSGLKFPRVFELVANDVPSPVYSTYSKKSKGEKKRQRSEWNRNMR